MLGGGDDGAGAVADGGENENGNNEDEDPDDESEEEVEEVSGGGGGGGITLEEVAKHNTEQDCWVVVNDEVLDVTKFLPDHPGGVLAIVTFAGKDATEEFNMIHPPDVIGKYAPDAVIGKLGGGGGGGEKKTVKVKKEKKAKGGKKAAKGTVKVDLAAPLLTNCDKVANEFHYRDHHEGGNSGWMGTLIKPWWNAGSNMVSAFLYETVMTLFTVTNFKFTNDRVGLTRSAILMILFMVIHAVGNLHIFLGPDDFNGYGYFYVRLYWTSLGIVKANIVEVYIALGAMLHVLVAIKRTWDINRNYTLNSGKLNLALTGVLLLIFMTNHLFQFRVAATEMYLVRPPPYLINFWGILKLQLFWVSGQDYPDITPVPVRDIYKLEFDLFQNPLWVLWYMFSTCMFLLHACWGWAKLVPSTAFGIPKPHHKRVTFLGYCIMFVIFACYSSFPLYCYFGSMKRGNLGWQNESELYKPPGTMVPVDAADDLANDPVQYIKKHGIDIHT